MDLLGTLEIRQPAAAEGNQIGLASLRFGSEHHRRFHLLAPGGMRHAETHRLGHRRMRQQHLVDFPWRDILAGPDDQLLDAAGQMQIAVFVQESLVAGAKPFAKKRLGGGLRIVLVFADHARTVDAHLARLAARQFSALLVANADAHPVPGPTEPALRAAGGNGLEAIWCEASVIP